MDEVNLVQHDPRGEAALARAWAQASGRLAAFAPEEELAWREIVARSFSAQLESCVRACHPSLQDLLGGDLGRATLSRALLELLAHFPIYRTYGRGDALTPDERAHIDAAIDRARRSCLATDRWAVDLLQCWFNSSPHESIHRFQQLSAPVVAKAVEDTAFYRYGRLLSRNDVGFNIERFAGEASAFHAAAQARRKHFPHAFIGDRNTRPQARRGCARAARRSERAGGQMGESAAGLDRAQCATSIWRCALGRRHCHAAADDHWRLASRSPPRGRQRATCIRRAPVDVAAEGPARGKAAKRLGGTRRGVRAGGEGVSL
jgi:hypothetical protein